MVKDKRKSSYNKVLLEIFPEQYPIAYLCCLTKLTGSATAVLFMSQLLYWFNKGDDPNWIYKTQKELQRETGLSRSEQDRAIKVWVGLGVLELKLKGVPCKRHFHINFQLLINLLKNPFPSSSLQNSANCNADEDNPFCTPVQHTTESTAESTQKNTNTEIFLKNNQLQIIQKQKQDFLNAHRF